MSGNAIQGNAQECCVCLEAKETWAETPCNHPEPAFKKVPHSKSINRSTHNHSTASTYHLQTVSTPC